MAYMHSSRLQVAQVVVEVPAGEEPDLRDDC
jgi:hypothetical protein